MRTAQIDIRKITPNKDNSFTVEYWDEHFYGEHNAIIQISEEALLDHVIDNSMNVYIDSDWDAINPKTYLNENRDEVILDYIQANS